MFWEFKGSSEYNLQNRKMYIPSIQVTQKKVDGLGWTTGCGSTIRVLECSLKFTDPDIKIVAKVKDIQQSVSQKVIEWRHFHFKL